MLYGTFAKLLRAVLVERREVGADIAVGSHFLNLAGTGRMIADVVGLADYTQGRCSSGCTAVAGIGLIRTGEEVLRFSVVVEVEAVVELILRMLVGAEVVGVAGSLDCSSVDTAADCFLGLELFCMRCSSCTSDCCSQSVQDLDTLVGNLVVDLPLEQFFGPFELLDNFAY